ncbi:MAG: DinB family protein [Pyrinomonadaceae bacterium]
METSERAELIERYADGYAEVMRSLDGIPADQLTTRAIPDKWTAAEIVHHLADSEMASALRLRKLLAEAYPVIFGYDQDEYALRLTYNNRAIEPALDAFRGARATTIQLLRNMTDDDWERTGWHTESGVYSAEKWLVIYAQHAHGHADQIARLREVLADGETQAAAV